HTIRAGRLGLGRGRVLEALALRLGPLGPPVVGVGCPPGRDRGDTPVCLPVLAQLLGRVSPGPGSGPAPQVPLGDAGSDPATAEQVAVARPVGVYVLRM